jgi:hypothetical protein
MLKERVHNFARFISLSMQQSFSQNLMVCSRNNTELSKGIPTTNIADIDLQVDLLLLKIMITPN